MPTFDTPEPISATIELAAGNLRVSGGDPGRTVVEVRPTDPADDADVQAAEQTRVEYGHGRLLVRSPRTRARWWIFQWWSGSVDVTVELPAGSRIDVAAARADIHGEGRLGEAKVTSGSGDVRLDQTGKLRIGSSGDISVARAVGPTEVSTANGEIWIREIDGPAQVKTANGTITLGEVTGDLRLNTAHGDISVDRALGGVSARTAAGSVRIGEVVRGSVVLETASGELEVGIREGTAAWLDLRTLHGTVHSSLEPSDGPGPADQTVEVRARTSSGDIVVRRA
jgi:putative adhesin